VPLASPAAGLLFGATADTSLRYSATGPQATAGIDTNLDGRPNIFVTGIDRNRDGIPDVLQASSVLDPVRQTSTVQPYMPSSLSPPLGQTTLVPPLAQSSFSPPLGQTTVVQPIVGAPVSQSRLQGSFPEPAVVRSRTPSPPRGGLRHDLVPSSSRLPREVQVLRAESMGQAVGPRIEPAANGPRIDLQRSQIAQWGTVGTAQWGTSVGSASTVPKSSSSVPGMSSMPAVGPTSSSQPSQSMPAADLARSPSSMYLPVSGLAAAGFAIAAKTAPSAGSFAQAAPLTTTVPTGSFPSSTGNSSRFAGTSDVLAVTQPLGTAPGSYHFASDQMAGSVELPGSIGAGSVAIGSVQMSMSSMQQPGSVSLGMDSGFSFKGSPMQSTAVPASALRIPAAAKPILPQPDMPIDSMNFGSLGSAPGSQQYGSMPFAMSIPARTGVC
jgi:hypothetical protein